MQSSVALLDWLAQRKRRGIRAGPWRTEVMAAWTLKAASRGAACASTPRG